jgi:integrase
VPRKPTGTAYEKDGHLYAQVTLPGGKRRPFPCPAHVKTLARAKLYAAFLSERLRAGTWVPVGDLPDMPAMSEHTFRAWCERWLEARKRRGLVGGKDDESRLRVHVWPHLGDRDIVRITTTDLERLVAHLDQQVQSGRMSWKLARNVWGLVSKAFSDAVKSKDPDLRVLTANPAASVAPPDKGAVKSKVYLWPSEFLALVRCTRVPLRYRRLVALSVYLYCRAGELEALRWDALDLDHGVVHIHQATDRYRDIGTVRHTKGKEARRYSIEPALLPLLRQLREEAGGAAASGLVVKMPPAEDLADRLRQYLQWAGVTREELFVPPDDPTRKRITWHDLRATGITWRAVRGDEPLRIQSAAGHKDFGTTAVYVREAEALARGFGQVFPPLDDVVNAYEASLPVNDIAVLHEPFRSEPGGRQRRMRPFAASQGVRIPLGTPQDPRCSRKKSGPRVSPVGDTGRRFVLLVCGSRTLTRHPDARARLARALAPALDAAPLVLTGGAPGPDTWALDLARARGLSWVALLPSGVRLSAEGAGRWSPVPVYPLARNLALVRLASAHREAGARVLVVGAVDPASPTHGTDHTLAAARGAGLPVRRLVLDL